jgi:hypothetical protein
MSERRDVGTHSRRAVLGAAAALGVIVPTAPAALAADRAGAAHGTQAFPDTGPEPRAESRELWGASMSGQTTGVRGNGRTGVAGEGTHTGVIGDGFVGIRGSTSIVDDDQRGVGVWAEAVAPGSTALRADGASEFNGVTRFARSGVALVRRGNASVIVSGVPLTRETTILATLQSRADGVMLHAIETDVVAGSFTIFLTAAPPRDLQAAWIALG